MSTRALGVDWVFGWMEARTASAYALLGETIAFTHENDVGLDREARRLMMAHLIIASSYLRTLLLALRPDLEEVDAGAVAEALAELGSRHRPRARWRSGDGRSHVRSLVRAARKDAQRVRRLLVRLRSGRSTAVTEGLEGVLAHLGEAESFCSSGLGPHTQPPDGDAPVPT